MSSCVFCKIASGEIASQILYQDEKLIAFRDINPVSPVHVLIIPKEHVSSLNDVNDFSLVSGLVERAVILARELGLENGYRLVVNTGNDGGQSVEHLHVHLLGGRNLAWPPG